PAPRGRGRPAAARLPRGRPGHRVRRHRVRPLRRRAHLRRHRGQREVLQRARPAL
ncbi:MAG: hypothetical protein AVDCRST_MAG48-253, partial [uncultured Friedmanniella sp.]